MGTETHLTSHSPHVPVCILVASASEVAVLHDLLRALPVDLGLAYLVLLSPASDDPALTVDRLAAGTGRQACLVDAPQTLRPEQIYFIPSDRAVLLAGHSVVPQDESVATVDGALDALAAGHHDLIALVLAQASTEVSAGLRAMQDAGNTVILQTPAEADHPGLSLARLAAEMTSLARGRAAERSAETLRAANKDLQAINAELQGRLESTSIAHSDLRNLIAATDIGTLFLDTQLRIRIFTPAVADIFAITGSDTGRLITDFGNRLVYDDLAEDARKVLRDLLPIETEVQGKDGKWFIIRLRPYRTIDNQIEGVVLTFVDITTRRRIEKDLRESQQNYQVLFDSIDEGFAIIKVIFEDDIAVDYRFIKVNSAFERQTGLADAQGRSAVELVPDIEQHWPLRYGQVAISGKPERFEAPSDVMGRYFDVYAFPIGLKVEQLVGILFRDVTERKEAEHQRQMLTNELSHRVKNTLAVVQALARQPGSAQMTVEQYRDRFVGRIQALGHAHDQLLETHWNSADLETLARKALSPYGGQGRRALDIIGPQVLLTPKQGLGLALVLHELATNASKYGALSTEDGALSLTWWIASGESGQRVELLWQEQGGPAVAAVANQGFGTRLITQACTYELDGSVELSPCETGYIARISFPMDRIAHG